MVASVWYFQHTYYVWGVTSGRQLRWRLSFLFIDWSFCFLMILILCITLAIVSHCLYHEWEFSFVFMWKTEIVKWYAIYQNATEVARQFHSCFGRTPPATKNILSLVKMFDETGSLEDKPRSGCPRSIATDETKNLFLRLMKKILWLCKERLLYN